MRSWAGAGHLAAPLKFRDAVLGQHRVTPFDVVEATNWYAPAVLLAGSHQFPVVTRNSTPARWSQDGNLSLRDKFDGFIADALERQQGRKSGGQISNTEEHGRRISELYGLSNDVPHATIGLSLSQVILERASQSRYPLDDNPIRILFVGRAEPRKGFRELMSAIELLSNESDAGTLPDFRADLLGVSASDLPGDLTSRARRRIHALGRQPDAILFELYEAAHIVAAPSRYESFGLVYQEAMAFGRPLVVSAEDPSARDFVGAPGGGILASSTEGEAIATALRRLLLSRELRMSIREKGLQAAGSFTRATLGSQTLDLYAAAIERFKQQTGSQPHAVGPPIVAKG
jgi:glycosyltransferase involved in cell wall biosynthesis